jgi:hypothetical protein
MKKLTYSEAGRLGYFASKEKRNKNRQDKIDEYNQNPKICFTCNISLPYKKRNNKFCSHSCSASSNNLGVRRNGLGGYIGDQRVNCANCGELIKHNRKFCNRVCESTYKRKKRDDEIIKNPNLAYHGAVKKFLIKQRGHVCEICKLSVWMGKPISLEMDHIDGNSYNNSFENVRIVCPNCHAQTPTYKGKNLGSGRYKRRVRYASGKSY